MPELSMWRQKHKQMRRLNQVREGKEVSPLAESLESGQMSLLKERLLMRGT